MLSRFVIAFLPRSKCLLITWLQILEAKKIKFVHCVHFVPFYLPWSKGTGGHDLSFLMLSFEPAFSLSSFTLFKRLFNSSSLSAIRVDLHIWSCYFSWQSWFQLVIHPVQHFTWCTLHTKKLNKQDDNIQPCRTPLPILNQSVVPCLVLTVASDPQTGFLGDS